MGCGAAGRPAGASEAARWPRAGTEFWNAWPLAVAPAGASIVTLVTLVMLVTLLMLLWLLTSTLPCTRMPTLTTGGALTTTAGGVPMGAGTMRPWREPGGGGTNTPCGPIGGRPKRTPGAAIAIEMLSPGAGGTKWRSGAHQKPGTKTTTSARCS